MTDPKESRMVLLTGSSREHVYVANLLASEVGIRTVFIERPGTSTALRPELLRLHRKYGAWKLPERFALRAWKSVSRHNQRRDNELRRILGPSTDAFDSRISLNEVADLNGPKTRAELQDRAPHVILVYGTRIIRDSILSTAVVGALNMHTGISPEYRGTDCAFWPVHDERFDLLGATVHECTSAVDGGRILGTKRAQLNANDDLHGIFARCVAAGAELYPSCVRQVLERGEMTGVVQPADKGREYRSGMRGIGAELRAHRVLSSGNLRSYVRGTLRP